MTEKQQTSFAILKKAKEIAEKNNVSFVYIGNIQTDSSNTYCPKCKNLTIERNFLSVSKNILNHDKCPFCKTKIKGIWD
jgi:pyruvate formate lyase activating enzyme